jgi:hypothetical protein
MSALFLTKEELQELTGYTLLSKQAAWLKSHRYIFELDKRCAPKVLRSHLIEKMTKSTAQVTAAPNFEALKRGKKTA